MKTYTYKTLSVDDLRVDLKNPRLPKSRAFIDPTSVMDYLQEKENILEVAESMSDNGLFPSEPLIAVEEDGVFSVVEGNRRLVAMKLLKAPATAIKQQAKFKEASAKADLTELDELNVIVYESRLAAAPVLIKRHTNDPAKLKSWEMIMKAHYTTSFMTTGKTLQEVATSLSIDVPSLRMDLETLQLYNLAQSLPFEASILEKINDESKFPLSTINRAVRSSSGSTIFKLDFKDEEGKAYLTYDKKEFLKPFTKLITDIVSDDFNSRNANTAAEIEAYFENYNEKFKPNVSITGSDSLDDVIAYASSLKGLNEIYVAAATATAISTTAQTTTADNTSNTATSSNSQNNSSQTASAATNTSTSATAATTAAPNTTTTPATKKTTTKPKTRKRTSVIFQDVNVVRNFSKQRVTLIVTELKKIDANKFKNSAGVLLRTLLDIVTHEFLKSLKEDVAMFNEAKAKLKPGQKIARLYWTPELYAMLNRIAKNKYGLPNTALSALNTHLTMKGDGNILFMLNEIVHNPDFSFTKQDLLDIFDKLEPYLKEVL